MKITFISPPPNLSGGIRVIALYADFLVGMGHDVTVITQGHGKPGRLRRFKNFLRGHKPRVFSKISHFDTMKARLHEVDDGRSISDADVPDADVVIATFWTTAETVAKLPDRKGRKFYFIQQYEIHDPVFAQQAKATYLLPLKKIAVSGQIRDAMRAHFGDHEVQVVPNAVDQKQFQFRARDKQDAPTVSLIYSGKKVKALDSCLAALERVHAQLPDLRVLAFGTHEPLDSLPLADYVTYVQSPPQNEIPRIYAASDLYLFGSRYEGFGLPVLEAMACGCPVVATRTGCAHDVIEEGKTGYVVDVDDVEALASAMMKVLTSDTDTWKAMSRDAACAMKGYSWDASATAFAKALGL